MFDSPIQNWCPGQLQRIGYPWHGRVDRDGQNGALLTLPNGRVIRLPVIFATGARGPGVTHRFRDPRAVDVPLEGGEAERAVAAGAQWRADVIFGDLGIVGGAHYPNTRGSKQWWIYHDGYVNRRVNISFTFSLYLNELPVLGRFPADQAKVPVERTYPSAADLPPSFYVTSELVVIDVLPDGSRALVVRNGWRRNWRGRAERAEPVAFYEVTLSGAGNDVHARVDLLYGPADIEAGWSRELIDNRGSMVAMKAWTLQWSTMESGVTATSSVSFALGNAGSFDTIRWPEAGGVTLTERHQRVVSMYYGAGGDVRRITYDYALDTVESDQAEYSRTDQPATALGGGGSSFPMTFVSGGMHQHSVTSIKTVTSTVSARLLDDGELVSAVSGEAQSLLHRHWLYTIEVVAGGLGGAVADYSGEIAVNASWSRTTTHDGHQIDAVSDSASSSNWATAWRDTRYTNRATFNGWNGGWGAEFLIDSSDSDRDRLQIIPMQYNAQMHALGTTRWKSNVFPELESAWLDTLSTATVQGRRAPGWVERDRLEGGYYGSRDPVTGEVLRDTPGPVTFI